MPTQDILLELHCTDAAGMPRDAIYRLESLTADEVKTTIATAALMLTFDADENSPIHTELTAVNAKIEAAGDEIRRSWLDRKAEAGARVATAVAWRDAPCSAVLVQGYWRAVAWSGRLGELVETMTAAIQCVALNANAETATRLAAWPVPAPVEKAPPAPPATDGELVLTPTDLDASIQAAKAKAAAAKAAAASPELDAIRADASAGKPVSLAALSVTLTDEQKVQELVKTANVTLAEARKKVRSGKA